MKKMQSVTSAVLLFALAATLLLAACGGSSSTTISSLTILPTVTSISIGTRQSFTVTARNSAGSAVGAGALTWASSATSVATVDSNGVATGVSAGTTQITATSANNIVSSAASLVVLPQISSVAVTPISATLHVGNTQQFTAVAKDAQGNSVSNAIFTWAISYSGVATIDNNGLVTAVSPGTVTVSASVSNVTSPFATLTVTP